MKQPIWHPPGADDRFETCLAFVFLLCWFESGSMPYAQNHYPFENEKETLDAFPADFIAEGLDQTRAWFYTLNILSTALFDKPAFKNVIVNWITSSSSVAIPQVILQTTKILRGKPSVVSMLFLNLL